MRTSDKKDRAEISVIRIRTRVAGRSAGRFWAVTDDEEDGVAKKPLSRGSTPNGSSRASPGRHFRRSAGGIGGSGLSFGRSSAA